jgi:hypothetical protein
LGSKNLKFYADFKMGLFIVVSSSYQKLGTLAAEGSTFLALTFDRG